MDLILVDAWMVGCYKVATRSVSAQILGCLGEAWWSLL